MKREVVVTLTYTTDELNEHLVKSLQALHKIEILAVSSPEQGKIVITAREATELTKMNTAHPGIDLISNVTETKEEEVKSKRGGARGPRSESLATLVRGSFQIYDRIPLDSLLKEVVLKFPDYDLKRLKTYMYSLRDEFVQAEPEVYMTVEAYNQTHNKEETLIKSA